MDRRAFLKTVGAVGVAGAATRASAREAAPLGVWRKLPTEPFRGKQDDVVFVDRTTGWYGNGAGKLFKTVDGGETWTSMLDRPGLFVRALGFVDASTGFLGNIGPGYFPNVTDATPLYRTRDGGATWTPVVIEGPPMTGVCAIDVLRRPFVNAGVLDHRVAIRAAGRVGGPAFLAESLDGGETWVSRDMGSRTAMIFDVKFVTERVGFIAGASSADVQSAVPVILRTEDGGRTWSEVFRGGRPFELTWKISFPTPDVGYVTLQSYDPDTTKSRRHFAKSTDGGRTWSELPLIDSHPFRAFGVGFLDERRGWIGGSTGGLETVDGGATWRPVEMGRAVNKIRILRDERGVRAVAIGVDMHVLDLPA